MSFIPIADENHWHELRKLHIGGTEVSAMFGLNPHKTPFELWHLKNGSVPEADFSDNDRVFWGKHLEPAIAAGISAKTGWVTEKVTEYCVNDDAQGHGVTMDFKITSDPRGLGALEIKTVDWLEFKKWEDGQPPIWYELQLQSQLECSKWSWGAIGVLVGGNDLKLFEYERRPITGAKIAQGVREFWQTIRDNIPPEPIFEVDSATISLLYSNAGSGWINLSSDDRVDQLCEKYSIASAEETAAKTRKQAAKAELLTIIQSYDNATSARYKISAKEVAASTYEVTREAYRNFRVSKIKEK